jgi:polysaccharide pyruvyl transferase WcaK-like protein
MLNICLIMHSAKSDNFGVGALTVSEVEIIRTLAKDLGCDAAITLIDWKDPRDAYVTGADIRIIPVSTKDLINPFGYFATLRRSDIVIDIGAGDSFADIYGPKRLTLMFLMKFLVHLARRPLVLAPQTMGPFTKGLSKWLALRSLNLCKLVSTRDTLSTDFLRQMGYRGDIVEASDVALRLPYQRPEKQSGPVRVGLNVSGLLMRGGYTQDNMFGLQGDYGDLIRRIIQHFLEHEESCELYLVPHVISKNSAIEDDNSVSEKLAKDFPAVRMAPVFETPSEAKSFISELDFFMGARMHACIAALSSGVPVIPMAYSRKFAGLFGSLGYDQTVDCTSESNEAILEKIFAGFANRATLARQAAMACAEGQTRLGRYEDALRRIMSDVPGR